MICRVFQKSLILDRRINANEMDRPFPPSMDTNFVGVETAMVSHATHHVSCFSNVMDGCLNTQFFTAPNNYYVDTTAFFDMSGHSGGGYSLDSALRGDSFVWNA